MKRQAILFRAISLCVILAIVFNDVAWALQVQSPFSAGAVGAEWAYKQRLDQELNLIKGMIDKHDGMPYPDLNAALDSAYIASDGSDKTRLIDVISNPVIDSTVVSLEICILAGSRKGDKLLVRWDRSSGGGIEYFDGRPSTVANPEEPDGGHDDHRLCEKDGHTKGRRSA